jgi:hypothetical protein
MLNLATGDLILGGVIAALILVLGFALWLAGRGR